MTEEDSGSVVVDLFHPNGLMRKYELVYHWMLRQAMTLWW